MSESLSPDLKYSDTHEWIKIEGHEGLIGLTHHALKLLGSIVYVELPQVGAHYVQDAEIGVIESVKSASDLYAPLSGDIVAVNSAVLSNPDLLNQESDHWLYRIRFSHLQELDHLMTAEAYEAALQA